MWASRLALIRASLLMLDGRFADCAVIVSGESGFFALVVASHLAVLTGDGLENVERDVRAVLDDVPYFARGWHALLLGALCRLDEARTLWRAIAPYVRDMPRQSPEWLIGTVGHARMSVLLDDLDTAAVVYEQLLPFARLQAVGSGDTPNYGPVSLHLGRLALLLGRAEQARSQLTAALRAAAGIHALPYVAMAHLELARLSGFPSTEAAAHEEAARRMAARLGMAPLAAEVAALTTSRSHRQRGPLSRRENEVAALVAEGLSNRAIAERLFVSERTVENHVSHIMRKIDRSSRVGVAGWFIETSRCRRGRSGRYAGGEREPGERAGCRSRRRCRPCRRRSSPRTSRPARTGRTERFRPCWTSSLPALGVAERLTIAGGGAGCRCRCSRFSGGRSVLPATGPPRPGP